MNMIIKISLIIFSVLLISCGGEETTNEKDKVKEDYNKGVISYTVSYPYFKGEGLAKAMLPKKLLFVFQDGLINVFTKKGGMMKMGVMGCPKEDSITMYLDFGNLDICSNFSSDKVIDLINYQTKISIKYVEGEEKEIAGFNCKKAIGSYEDGSNPDFDIYYTEEIDVESPNFYNQYAEIKGVLMEYEIERFGLVSKIVADSYSKEITDDNNFELDTNFLTMQFLNFEGEIRSIFEKTVGAEHLTKKDSLQ